MPFAARFAVLITILLASAAQAEPFVSTRDTFKSGPRLMTGFDHVLWGRGSPRDRRPGLWAGFYALPDPSYPCALGESRKRLCDDQANGRCTTDGAAAGRPLPPDLIRARTGIPADHATQPMCPATGQRGDAFVALSQDPEEGGIGVYLHSGTGDNGRQAFLQITDGTKHNDVQGIYIHFRALFMEQENWMRPFAGAGDCPDQACREAHKLTVATEQSYAGFRNNGQSAAFQIIRLIVRNTNGTPDNLKDDALLNVGIRSFCDQSSVAKNGVGCRDRASVDPEQGRGQQYMAGQYGSAGTETTIQISHDLSPDPFRVRMWTSHGAETANTPFENRVFRASISWPQFVSMLRGVAFRTGQDGKTAEGVAAYFGDDWQNPDNWVVQTFRFGQELKNPNWNGAKGGDSTASSGGALHWFSLAAEKP